VVLVGPALMQHAGEVSYVRAFAGVSIGFALIGAVLSVPIALLVRRRLCLD
jgi:hypothetical protein